MEPRKLTDFTVDKIKPPAAGREDHWDALLPGFGLRVSCSGTKSWLAMVRIIRLGEWKQTRLTLGRYPALSLADAREKAREAIALAQARKDPRGLCKEEERKLDDATRHTYGVVRERYIAFLRKRGKRSAGQIESVLKAKRLTAIWETRPVTDIPRREVIAMLKAIDGAGTPIAANRTLTYLRSMMNWAAKHDSAEFDYEFSTVPTDHVAAPAVEVKRDRYLTEEEIKLAWPAFDAAGLFSPIFKLLLLTGQRLREIGEMRRSELNLDSDTSPPVWIIPASRTKNGRAHIVPLSSLAVSLLRSIPNLGDVVFTTTGNTPVSGYSNAKEKVDAAIVAALDKNPVLEAFIGLREVVKIREERTKRRLTKEEKEALVNKVWVVHDLRRTFATHSAELGISLDVVELCLNHASGARSGVAGIYNRSKLLPERRAAMDRWASHVETLISGKEAESWSVVFLPMRRDAALSAT